MAESPESVTGRRRVAVDGRVLPKLPSGYRQGFVFSSIVLQLLAWFDSAELNTKIYVGLRGTLRGALLRRRALSPFDASRVATPQFSRRTRSATQSILQHLSRIMEPC